MGPVVEHRVCELKTGDGTRLFAQRWAPSGTIRAELVLVHGFAEHCGRYWKLADELNRRGMAVSAVDLRGHGRSSGTRGFVQHFDEYGADVEALLEMVREQGVEAPRFLLGHSMGGLVAARFLQTHSRHGFEAALFSGPFFGFGTPVPLLKDLAARILARVAPTFSLPTEIAAESLSHDPDEMARYESDPLVLGRATSGWYIQACKAQQAVFQQAGRIELPLLVLLGGEDIVVSRPDVERFVVEVGSEDKSLVIFPELRHEIFNEREPDRQEVIDCALRWLDARC